MSMEAAVKPQSGAERLAEVLYLTAEERRECERAAGNAGEQPSTWIRQRLVEVAKREMKG